MNILKRIINKATSKGKTQREPDLHNLTLALNSPSKKADASAPKHRNVLVYTFEPLGLYAWRESIISRSLELRGARVSLFQCDLALKANDMDNVLTGSFFANNIQRSISFYEGCGFDVKKLSQYVKEEKINEFRQQLKDLNGEQLSAVRYQDLDIGLYSLNSTVRYFLMPLPDFNNEEFVSTFREYVLSCLIIAEATNNLLMNERPDKVFTSHAIYISWSPLFYLCRKNNIPVDVYGGTYRANTLRIYRNEPAAPFPPGLWEKYRNKPLSAEENAVLDNYIPSRKDNRNDSIKLFSEDAGRSGVFSFSEEQKKKGNVLFCLFTNIAWDGFMFREKTVFPDMFDWIRKNIEFFKNNPGFSLIIKAHPAENAKETKTPEQYRVSSIIPELPDNIYFCKPDENVKPFDLYPTIDIGLIHISTVAIEMALEGIPVLTSGANGHYSNKGFTIDPQTIEEYFDYVKKLGEKRMTFQPDKEAARRYMYFRFFREAIPFEPLTLSGWAVKKLNINSCDDLKPAKMKGLDTICNGILNDTEFSYDWTSR